MHTGGFVGTRRLYPESEQVVVSDPHQPLGMQDCESKETVVPTGMRPCGHHWHQKGEEQVCKFGVALLCASHEAMYKDELGWVVCEMKVGKFALVRAVKKIRGGERGRESDEGCP